MLDAMICIWAFKGEALALYTEDVQLQNRPREEERCFLVRRHQNSRTGGEEY